MFQPHHGENTFAPSPRVYYCYKLHALLGTASVQWYNITIELEYWRVLNMGYRAYTVLDVSSGNVASFGRKHAW